MKQKHLNYLTCQIAIISSFKRVQRRGRSTASSPNFCKNVEFQDSWPPNLLSAAEPPQLTNRCCPGSPTSLGADLFPANLPAAPPPPHEKSRARHAMRGGEKKNLRAVSYNQRKRNHETNILVTSRCPSFPAPRAG